MICQRLSTVALGLFLFLGAPGAFAQDCGCDHEVEPETLSLNGNDMGVQPGETICIQAGARDFLRLYEMNGTADAPIVIKNCGGQVEIDNSDRGYGLTLEGSSFVQITGSGHEGEEYGFKIRASKDGPDYSASCIVASGLSTDYELDHIEAYDCGFAGVSAKTDPTCDDRDLSGFVQRNSRLHHLYLHDTGGEGIYFGSTGYPSRTRNCEGQDVELIPHSHEGVWIHDNIIEDTGWDGAQVGVSPKDCYIYRNRIARVGLRMEQYQMQGFQVGGGSSCEVTNNFIAHGPATGIIVLDAGDMLIANNVILDFADSIYINDRDSEFSDTASVAVVHNTVVGASNRGITMFGTRTQSNAFINNLIVDAGDNALGVSNDVDAVKDGNLILTTVAEALFVDEGGEDFRLLEGAPAVDAGVEASAWGVAKDQLSAPRDAKPDAGAFEFGAEAPDEPTSPPGPGTDPSAPASPDSGAMGGSASAPSDGDSEGDNGGCGCKTGGRPAGGASPAWALSLLLVGLCLWRRRLS